MGQYHGKQTPGANSSPFSTTFWIARSDADFVCSQEAFNFFDDDVDSTPALDLLSELSYDLAESGGCRHNASTNIEDIVGYEQACMVQYCCSSALNSSVSRNPKGSFPFISNLSIEDACAFNTCQQSNKGNPDLGGIGVRSFFPRHVEEKIMLIVFSRSSSHTLSKRLFWHSA